MKKVILIFLSLLIFLMSFSSCIPSINVNNRILIDAIGIDFEDEKYNLSMEYININSEDEKGEKEKIYSQGASIIDALKNAEKKYGKSLFYSHNKVIILGEGLLTDKIKAIKPLFSGNYATRANTEIFYYNGKAQKLIDKNKYDFKYLNTITLTNGNGCTLLDLVNNLNEDYFSLSIPMIEETDEEVLNIDKSILTNGNEINMLSKIETETVNIIRGKIDKTNFLIKIGEDKVSIDVKGMKSSIDFDGENFNILITGQSSLSEKISNDYVEKDLIKYAQTQINENIQGNIEYTLNNILKKYQIDCFDFYKYYRQYDYNLFKENQDKLIETMNNFKVVIVSEIKVNRIGLEVL